MNVSLRTSDRNLTAVHCVVGSGPAGVACAQALLQQGATVTMLDAGVELEPERAGLVAQMRAVDPAAWSSAQLAALREGTAAVGKELPLKRLYGSDFPYRHAAEHVPADYAGVDLRPSLAQGGLSNVWGAAMLPYIDRDMAAWPITAAQLAEHYAAVLKFTGISARHDDLAALFPLFVEAPRSVQLSRQATILLRNLEKSRTRLQRAGIHFGQSRTALRVAAADTPGCVYCSQCMYGCPYGYIYNAASTLQTLRANPRFSYQQDVVVTTVHEAGEVVRIAGYHRVTRVPFATEVGRAYLAAGVIPTTQILLRSQERYDQTVWLQDSQYFLVPLALARSAGDVTRESMHVLSQLFIEMLDPQVSPHTVHLQVYSWNDIVGAALRRALGPLAWGPFELLARQLERRLLIVQGYLHSDHSPPAAVTLRRNADGSDRLELSAQVTPGPRAIINRVIDVLARHGRALGAWPLRPMLQVTPAGRGFHTGGTLPMRAQPGALETDVLGRLPGMARVHAVDATVLPNIPATTITFSVMANAHRIGWQSAGMA
jgi:choline dehydrogenase-like flavoprotein